MNTPGNHDFDDRMRRQHMQALVQVSARTRAQLQLRGLAAATSPQRSPRYAFAWPLAAACAAGVLAIGLQWGQSDSHVPVVYPPTTASEDDFASAYVALDESPDFYLWLASNDAAALAME